MTKNSNKNREINGSLPDHSAFTDLTQNQTAILITNEQPRIGKEFSKAVSAENNQLGIINWEYCSWEKALTGVLITIICTYLFVKLVPASISLISNKIITDRARQLG